MEITDVKVIPVDDEKLKAFVSIVFDHCFVVTDLKVIHGPKGLFVSMPRYCLRSASTSPVVGSRTTAP